MVVVVPDTIIHGRHRREMSADRGVSSPILSETDACHVTRRIAQTSTIAKVTSRIETMILTRVFTVSESPYPFCGEREFRGRILTVDMQLLLCAKIESPRIASRINIRTYIYPIMCIQHLIVPDYASFEII